MAESPQNRFIVVGCNVRSITDNNEANISITDLQELQFEEYLNSDPMVAGYVIIRTCNRTEIYVEYSPLKNENSWIDLFCRTVNLPQKNIYFHSDSAAVYHLMQVASGLDSEIVGETEILGQIKSAYEKATQNKTLSACLHRICQKSIQAAKWVRSHTKIGYGHVSLGNIVVDLSLRVHGNLKRSPILLIGMGQVGQDAATALNNRGAKNIFVTNRTEETAINLASEIGAKTIAFDCWKYQLSNYDIIISCTSSETTLITEKMMEAAIKKRPSRPIFLIDLAVPNDIEPSIETLENVYLYSLKDLAEIANKNLDYRKEEIHLAQQNLSERSARVWKDAKNRMRFIKIES
jgi:glutamyl-tRNA reductase